MITSFLRLPARYWVGARRLRVRHFRTMIRCLPPLPPIVAPCHNYASATRLRPLCRCRQFEYAMMIIIGTLVCFRYAMLRFDCRHMPLVFIFVGYLPFAAEDILRMSSISPWRHYAKMRFD